LRRVSDRPAPLPRDVRLGIDVGGTFTDVVAVLPDRFVRGKVRSTPEDPGAAVVAACELAAEQLGVGLPALLGALERFGLGTTVVTNVLATRSGRRLGMLTTLGFEDLVPLARGNRVSAGGWLLVPPALVDRTAILGLDERTDRGGVVRRPVDPAAAVAAATTLVEREGAEAIVVSFLWSFRNPANEQAVRTAVEAALPHVPVVLGSDLAPVIREYERTQFALLNAYVGGSLDWLGPLGDALRANGLTAPIVLTHSNGGATTVEGARAAPIGLAQSGPSAGAAASSQMARALGEPDVVTCDLGGTSLDVALIAGGQALRRTRGRIVGHWTSLSMVDIDSVGSGGGSLAWVDPVGAIRVGPQSAGADPGPACYGRGGTAATVTDALVVLGFLDPTRFLDGRMPLDAGRAHDACAAVGKEAGIDAVEAAWGIREVALATMARAVRNRIASRGLVASDLTVLAFGGCGGLFAGDIAHEVGARRAVVPELAPVFSAYGAATAVLRRERSRSVAQRLPGDPAVLLGTLAELRTAVLDDLRADGVDAATAQVRLEADVRFERQGSELTVPIEAAPDGTADLSTVAPRFVADYVARFGEGAVAMGVAVEVMTLRAVGQAPPRADDERLTAVHAEGAGGGPAAPIGTRPVRLARDADNEVPVYRMADLAAGAALVGPAIVDAGDTTVWVVPGHRTTVDEHGSLIMEV
jgi:N-methylhydantoinase A